MANNNFSEIVYHLYAIVILLEDYLHSLHALLGNALEDVTYVL